MRSHKATATARFYVRPSSKVVTFSVFCNSFLNLLRSFILSINSQNSAILWTVYMGHSFDKVFTYKTHTAKQIFNNEIIITIDY